ncbi:aspartate/glutamate racemase family protein [Tessaracoccus sp. MC1756]|uniref:aspartate/glutamate racemase family protein n=1 Tax=Tessaracoccus sp. MC1756 TaxID=2760311 RepID=UPI0015FEE3F2|nr:aspartate/glutamate racemase family protein [Tessaracoccus sp. MC1756]MBB1510755.1 aspartate/glutamate racemase family protein [Tessaracoccus sp. MC1756]
MRTIGLIGGMSWESTTEYYRVINRAVAERLGGLHSAHVLLESLDFAEVEVFQAEGRWGEAGDVLADSADRLEAAGAEVVLICTNTMHKVADQVERGISVPLVHIGDATARAVLAAGVKCVGLLGTAFTMEERFYRERLESHGLSVLVPPADDRAEVHRVIYEELCRGQILDSSRRRLLEVIGRLIEAGVEGVILGCTELELLLDADDDGPVPLFATTRIHALAAVEAALRSDG